jgi:hypothetical protein
MRVARPILLPLREKVARNAGRMRGPAGFIMQSDPSSARHPKGTFSRKGRRKLPR